jgi:hypothetical protein
MSFQQCSQNFKRKRYERTNLIHYPCPVRLNRCKRDYIDIDDYIDNDESIDFYGDKNEAKRVTCMCIRSENESSKLEKFQNLEKRNKNLLKS